MWKFTLSSCFAVAVAATPAFTQPLPAPVPPPIQRVAATAPVRQTSGETRLFELRTYYAATGKIDQLNARFRGAALRLFARHGMTNIGFFVPVPNPDSKIVFLLAYPNQAAREASWKALAADPEWIQIRKQTEANGRLVDKIGEQFMTPTDYCPVVTATASSEPRVFELRLFTTTSGNLDAVNARIRKDITRVFGKHGVQSIGYWTILNKRPGAATTLVYLISHKSAEAREKAFDTLRSDPKWIAAGKVSQEYADIPLTAKDGKKDGKTSVILKPTDYSPLK